MGQLRMNTLIDSFGRRHKDLRVSLTDKCSLRCIYCMPENFSGWQKSDHLLNTNELMSVISAAVSVGIKEIRLTGGEPLLRPDIVDIVSRISALPNAPKLSLTTNGLRLAELARPLKDAGLERINVSLDTLDRDNFKKLTHRDRIDDVFAGLKSARDAGLMPIKINVVLLRGINHKEAPALLKWAMNEGFSMRFIEQMPLDAGGIWDRTTMVTAKETMTSLLPHFELFPVPDRGSSPAEEFYINGTLETVGIIASVTQPFCGACDRLRLTSDGQLRSCLFSLEEMDLRKVLRNPNFTSGEIEDEIAARLYKTMAGKLSGHGINDPTFVQPRRPMSAIGG